MDAAIDFVASRETLEGPVGVLARAGRLVIIGSRPKAVFGVDATFTVDPGRMLYDMLEIHGSRYVTLTEIAQTLELLRAAAHPRGGEPHVPARGRGGGARPAAEERARGPGRAAPAGLSDSPGRLAPWYILSP